MSSAPAPLARFTAAMQGVYGTLPSDFEEVKSWTPPPMSDGFKGRYLWTDAFGVVNFITLSRESQDDRYLTLAESLVQTVHNIQGRTRDGRSRLPGATDDNPLGGGLRIGKEDEGGPDGDGQYHHYLTLWMFALNRLSVATKDTKFNDQAIALAKAIHPHFFVGKDTASPRMVWKISTDMSTILVPSEGNLDPIDGHVIMSILQAHDRSRVLDREINDYKKIMDRKEKHFASDDTLDLGMTLWTSHWMVDSEKWATDLQRSCITQLNRLFADDGYRVSDMRFRLAFRDFGACLGINISQDADSVLRKYASELIRLWEERAGKTPGKLRPITEVMHAAALIPGAFKKGYLGPEPDF